MGNIELPDQVSLFDGLVEFNFLDAICPTDKGGRSGVKFNVVIITLDKVEIVSVREYGVGYREGQGPTVGLAVPLLEQYSLLEGVVAA